MISTFKNAKIIIDKEAGIGHTRIDEFIVDRFEITSYGSNMIIIAEFNNVETVRDLNVYLFRKSIKNISFVYDNGCIETCYYIKAIQKFNQHCYESNDSNVSTGSVELVVDYVKIVELERHQNITLYDLKIDLPSIDQIWYNDPYTSITWSDGTVTKCKAGAGDTYDKSIGVYICIAKKYFADHHYSSTMAKKLIKSGIDLKQRKLDKIARKQAKKSAE